MTVLSILPIEHGVRTAVADALGLYDDEVFAEASLVDDYGADDTDLAEILRAVEASTGVSLRVGALRAHVRGPLPDEEFQDATGFVTAAGLAHLARVLSRVDPRTLPARRIMSLVCVGDLVDFVAAAAAREA